MDAVEPSEQTGPRSRRDLIKDAAGLTILTVAGFSPGSVSAQEGGAQMEKGPQESSIPTFEIFSRSLETSVTAFVEKFRSKYPEASTGNAAERWVADRARFSEFQKTFGEEVVEREMQKLYDKTLRSSGSIWYGSMMRDIDSFMHILSSMGARALPESSLYSAGELFTQLQNASNALKRLAETIGIADQMAIHNFYIANREYFNLLHTIASVRASPSGGHVIQSVLDEAGDKRRTLHDRAMDLAQANDRMGRIYYDQQKEGALLKITRDLLGLTKK